MRTRGQHARRHGLADAYPTVVRRTRWLIVLLWIAGAAAATLLLPRATTSTAGLGGLVSANSPAVRAEKASAEHFSVPLLTNTMVVLHNPHGLPAFTQADAVLHALAIDQTLAARHGHYPAGQVLGALPLLDTGGLLPGSRHDGTTAVTYLYFAPSTPLEQRSQLAQAYAHRFRATPGTSVAVTGTAPARWAESQVLVSHLTLVAAVTIAFVCLVLALTFRSVLAPLLLGASATLSYLVAIRLLGWLGQVTTLSLPSELEPLIIALVLGILTDYHVFFLSGLRDRLREGKPPATAFRVSVRRNAPIVAVAGLTVAAGTASLEAGHLQLYRSFGPGLAVSVAVAAAAAVTFVPAMLSILGERVYWPSRPSADRRTPRDRRASWLVRLVSRRRGAALVSAVTIAGLGAAVYPLVHLQLDLSFIRTLPSDSESQQGARLAAAGFAAGIVAPTVLLVSPHGPATPTALHRLTGELDRQPGVAGVVGPGSLPLPYTASAFTSRAADQARYVLFFNRPPLNGDAVRALRSLESRVPTLLRSAGLRGARVSYAGDTAIASATESQTWANLEIIFAVAFAAEFVILAAFLRALLAPLLLLLSSVLVVAAALGLTTAVFQDALGTGGLAFYAPFATAVLLISLGSDYNVFGAGRIWEEADEHRLRRAIRIAMPETTRAVTTAGLILEGSFAVVALIPLRSFAEMAFTMFVGLLLDTFIVRSLLTPSLLALLGPVSGWPGHAILGRRRAAEPT